MGFNSAFKGLTQFFLSSTRFEYLMFFTRKTVVYMQLYMVCIWYVYCMYMVCILYVYGMYIVCVLYVYGMCTVCIWYVYCMYMVCVLYVYGMCIVCIRYVYGMYRAHPSTW
jgi:hypothetical protein